MQRSPTQPLLQLLNELNLSCPPTHIPFDRFYNSCIKLQQSEEQHTISGIEVARLLLQMFRNKELLSQFHVVLSILTEPQHIDMSYTARIWFVLLNESIEMRHGSPDESVDPAGSVGTTFAR
jgi:hypothetical protein